MAGTRRILKWALVAVLAVAVFVGGWITGRLGIGSVVSPASMTAVERQFSERMHNVALVGTFTIAGREDRTPTPDRYEIASVEKIGDDLWRFNTRMNCCGMGDSGVIPIAVPMRFIGDTPMIMMTDTGLPGIGTFTVRVLFYGDRYAGTWANPRTGGHMSGRIEKAN